MNVRLPKCCNNSFSTSGYSLSTVILAVVDGVTFTVVVVNEHFTIAEYFSNLAHVVEHVTIPIDLNSRSNIRDNWANRSSVLELVFL